MAINHSDGSEKQTTFHTHTHSDGQFTVARYSNVLTGYALKFWRKQEAGEHRRTQKEKRGIKPATQKKVHVLVSLSTQSSPIREICNIASHCLVCATI